MKRAPSEPKTSDEGLSGRSIDSGRFICCRSESMSMFVNSKSRSRSRSYCLGTAVSVQVQARTTAKTTLPKACQIGAGSGRFYRTGGRTYLEEFVGAEGSTTPPRELSRAER